MKRNPQALATKLAQLSAAEINAQIPRECYQRSALRQLPGVFASLLLLLLAVSGLIMAPWWTYPIFWFFAGTAGWGMVLIAHDCGHHSFSRWNGLNHFVGHLMMTPLLYPFHSWRLLHNTHHAHTNSRERDNNWVPASAQEFAGLSPWRRVLYRATRREGWWLGTAANWALDGFSTRLHSSRGASDVRFSVGTVIVFALLFFPAVVHFVGWMGLIKVYLVPWLAMHAWFSTVTLMHHTHPDVPYYDRENWSRAGSNLALTTYYRYPRWLEWLTHNIMVHAPHHVAPKIPHYRLRSAQVALRRAYPELVREEPFKFRALGRILRECHLHDAESGLYSSFAEARPI